MRFFGVISSIAYIYMGEVKNVEEEGIREYYYESAIWIAKKTRAGSKAPLFRLYNTSKAPLFRLHNG